MTATEQFCKHQLVKFFHTRLDYLRQYLTRHYAISLFTHIGNFNMITIGKSAQGTAVFDLDVFCVLGSGA